jgi:hypothetical protein
MRIIMITESENDRISQWRLLFPLFREPNRITEGTFDVTSPKGLVSVIQAREVLAIDRDIGQPTDVFLPSLGSPPDPAQTKIGGVPYRAKVENSGLHEQNLTFLAQVNFSQSMDLFRKSLPGQILLVFTDGDYLHEGSPPFFVFEWIGEGTTKSTSTIRSNKVVDMQCFGTLYRMHDFEPEGQRLERARQLLQERLGLPFGDPHVERAARKILCLCGIKIGGLPFYHREISRPAGNATFLFSLTDISPSPRAPWPFGNVEEPLKSAAAAATLCWYDGFHVNFFLTSAGTMEWTLELM